ncbi:MAG TPA: hypothetical protein VM432_02015 [Bdellovibrionales bacterium]|nr:hypothetical protein [Bdellovibrionales bacterium]
MKQITRIFMTVLVISLIASHGLAEEVKIEYHKKFGVNAPPGKLDVADIGETREKITTNLAGDKVGILKLDEKGFERQRFEQKQKMGAAILGSTADLHAVDGKLLPELKNLSNETLFGIQGRILPTGTQSEPESFSSEATAKRTNAAR